MKALTIGALAREVGVNVETIRYYQRMGLIEEPEKPAEGFRTYSQDILDDVQFIKKAQHIGFTLAEIRALLQGDKSCAETKELAKKKLLAIQCKIAEMENIAEDLGRLVSKCSGEDTGTCLIIESLRENTSAACTSTPASKEAPQEDESIAVACCRR